MYTNSSWFFSTSENSSLPMPWSEDFRRICWSVDVVISLCVHVLIFIRVSLQCLCRKKHFVCLCNLCKVFSEFVGRTHLDLNPGNNNTGQTVKMENKRNFRGVRACAQTPLTHPLCALCSHRWTCRESHTSFLSVLQSALFQACFGFELLFWFIFITPSFPAAAVFSEKSLIKPQQTADTHS